MQPLRKKYAPLNTSSSLLTYLDGIALCVVVSDLVYPGAGERPPTEMLSQTRTPRPREARLTLWSVLTLIRGLLLLTDLKERKRNACG